MRLMIKMLMCRARPLASCSPFKVLKASCDIVESILWRCNKGKVTVKVEQRVRNGRQRVINLHRGDDVSRDGTFLVSRLRFYLCYLNGIHMYLL